MDTDRVTQAIQCLKSGSREKARELLIREVREDPSNLTAWLWALEVAANDKEKRTILARILALDPAHQGAIQYLKKLDQGDAAPHTARSPGPGSESQPEHSTDAGPVTAGGITASRISGLLRLVSDWLRSLPSGCGIFALFMVILGGILIYFRVNTSFFGLAGTDFNELVISNSYELISSNEMYWEVQFEGTGESKYIGTVRHAGPIRIKEFPILTHDILVTTADFANPDLVDINVVDHKFFWKSPGLNAPSGSINLIHAIPANQEIYQVLLEVQKWDTVKITGREIYSVKAYQADGTLLGTWQDLGCNTLLIESISLLKAED